MLNFKYHQGKESADL